MTSLRLSKIANSINRSKRVVSKIMTQTEEVVAQEVMIALLIRVSLINKNMYQKDKPNNNRIMISLKDEITEEVIVNKTMIKMIIIQGEKEAITKEGMAEEAAAIIMIEMIRVIAVEVQVVVATMVGIITTIIEEIREVMVQREAEAIEMTFKGKSKIVSTIN